MTYYYRVFSAKLGFESRALHMLGKHCTTELGHQPSSCVSKNSSFITEGKGTTKGMEKYFENLGRIKFFLGVLESVWNFL